MVALARGSSAFEADDASPEPGAGPPTLIVLGLQGIPRSVIAGHEAMAKLQNPRNQNSDSKQLISVWLRLNLRVRPCCLTLPAPELERQKTKPSRTPQVKMQPSHRVPPPTNHKNATRVEGLGLGVRIASQAEKLPGLMRGCLDPPPQTNVEYSWSLGV